MTQLLATPAAWPRILLGRADAADPIDLDAAVAAGAFDGLHKAVRDLGPTATIATIAASGLRGRGGAGFPTGEKWRACASQPSDRRFVVANGYAADPASRTDVTLMERDPYAVIEGAVVAALAVGAADVVIAVRADARAAVEALEAAVAAATDAGFAGPDVLGSGRSVEIAVRAVQGAYMLGEETVLLKALEGKRGQPEQRPPYPAVRGLFDQPTVVNNVATLAAVPWILRNGPEAFAAIGTAEAPGTALVHVRGPQGEGIAEVPLGTTLRQVVDLVGGAGTGHDLKALVVGGPSGGILPGDALDTAYDYANLREAGAHLGSGSIILADERACIVDLARLLTRFCSTEACGKTIPCRIGTRRMLEISDRMAEGRARPSDPQLLDDLGHDIVASALCDHERLATLPMTSAMRYFRSELDDHILRSTCPAGVCRSIAAPSGAAR